MPDYSQENRPFRVDTKLGKDVLLLTGFQGKEAVSGLFKFRLSMLSTEDGIKSEDLLGTPMVLTIELPDGGARKVHGLVRRFTQLGQGESLLTAYEAEIVPWLWLLSLNQNSRIFQEKTAVDIIQQVFQDAGQADFQLKCTGSFPKRDYCVQYRESDLDFVSRLMEEEGIFYYFTHTDSKHTLVLANDKSGWDGAASSVDVRTQPVPDKDIITAVRRESSVALGKVSLRAYDYLQPSTQLESSISEKGKGKERTGELYDYPGRFTSMDGGDKDAKLILEAHEATKQLLHGDGSVRQFEPGKKFTLQGHFSKDANREYVLLAVSHFGHVSGYVGGAETGHDYQNSFTAIPGDTVYRPPRVTPKPVVAGSQTAVVVGRSGEEIFVDKYGRVKVQFFWDREGKKDDTSSCWVRVSSTWAGKGWGMIQIPRMGQEVIVDFLEGDPDRPIITGRVYNADQTPPYTLPGEQTISGVKSRSSKSGAAANCNEISMEDKKGEELLLIHAEKDKKVEVEHDRTEEVGNDEKITIKGNRTEEVQKDEKITIKGKRTEEVDKDETLTVKGKRSAKITGDDKLDTDGKLLATAVMDVQVKSESGKVTVESPLEIELKVGSNSIVINPAGVTIKGTMVKIEGQAMAEMKAPMVTVKGDAMLEASGGAMTNVKASGMLMAKGSLVMIN